MGWQGHQLVISTAIHAMEVETPPLVEMPDAAAGLRALEIRMAELRRGWNEEQLAAARDPESEVGPPTMEKTPYGSQVVQVTGTEFRTVVTRTAKRSFNTAAILHGLVEHGAYRGTSDALIDCVKTGVAKVEWKWTPLQQLARRFGLPLRTVDHVIVEDGDVDGPWVGECWSEQVSQKAIREDAVASMDTKAKEGQ